MKNWSRRQFGAIAGAAAQVRSAAGQTATEILDVYPGAWRVRFGRPEPLTPVSTRKYRPAETALRAAGTLKVPFPLDSITGMRTKRGMAVTIPLEPNELIYGLGLQFRSFMQRGLKKKLRVNADPEVDSGDSHAPVPFYVTTRGYGVLIDTARYATVYLGNKPKKGTARRSSEGATQSATSANALPAAYGRFRVGEPSEVIVEAPIADGIDVYVFAGPAMRDAVARYNLFSGGGVMPPRWGLGFWYRCFGQFDQKQVLATGTELRASRIPCDVLGLEPGWQTHAYSCSYVWSDKFPNPSGMLKQLRGSNYRVNLWEHAFVHPTSPIHKPLMPLSGDYEVWDGLVPDFLLPEARRVFAEFHEKEHIAIGADGYKLDECDNSDYTRNWSFPELSQFPSGADGEQMHSLFGLRYQDAIQSAFERRNQRTYGLVRSAQALAAPYPYVLYSDLYNHREFIRGVVNSGFSGLLWCPEVRDAKNAEDLLRRLQTVVFSPLAMVNAWYIQNPPWKQVDRESNNKGQFDPDWAKLEAQCRELIAWRMKLLPYFHAAFAKYRETGLPPFRALVMDWPGEAAVWTNDDQYMAGDSLMVAPVVAGQHEREVYLPSGTAWFDFWTNEKHEGGRKIRVAPPVERIPVFVRGNTLLPLAEGGLHANDGASWRVVVRAYGDAPAAANLVEQDEETLDPALTRVELTWAAGAAQGSVKRTGPAQRRRYDVIGWERVGSPQ